MIDIRKLKELVRLMVENDLTELDLQDQQETVNIRRGNPGQAPIITQAPVQAVPAPMPAAAPSAAPAGEPADSAGDEGPGVESPMVGTFYASPNPESDAFVKVGDEVGPDTVVCIVEAMKVFNEIKAGVSGTVSKILVKNGDAVEFGQKLMVIK